MSISIIAAVSKNGVIGSNNQIPWYLPIDLKHFKNKTLGNSIIMGRKTWESLPKRPLPKRNNFIITRNKNFNAKGAWVYNNLEIALKKALSFGKVFIIGGEQIYTLALKMNLVNNAYITNIYKDIEGDSFFPLNLLSNWHIDKGSLQYYNKLPYSFDLYTKVEL